MPANYVLLQSIQLTATTSSVTFSNIPQSGYTDLKIVASTRTAGAANGEVVNVSFNGSSANISARILYGDAPNAASITSTSNAFWTSGSGATSNTFGNSELYFPNYNSNFNKSWSTDSVTENNGGAYELLLAGLWSQTAAITSITFTPPAGSFVANCTFSLYGIAAVGTTPVIAPKATGGDTIVNDGTYWYHAFLSTGAFVPQTGLTCDALVIAGGGGGGAGQGGGGGAGGLLGFTNQTFLSGTSYTATVGAGGAGGTRTTQSNGKRGTTGNDSQLGALTLVKGGGYGGNYDDTAIGGNGGSGGGAGGGAAPPYAGGSPTSGQGNAGGSMSVYQSPYAGGGGGGAGAAGANGGGGSTPVGGAGSSAYSSWGAATSTGQNVSGTRWYAGGGGGAGDAPSFTYAGGNGGGGPGTLGVPTNAMANTGGGGGGSTYSDGPGLNLFSAGSGGSGIIIIRYPMA